MSAVDPENAKISFPAFPDDLRRKYSLQSLTVRPFGVNAQDLEVDFHVQPRPRLVTQLLQCCTVPEGSGTPEDFFWDLSISKRIQALMTIVAAGAERPFKLPFPCVNHACRESLEIEISLEILAELQAKADSSVPLVLMKGNEKVSLDLPTGRDQLIWLTRSYPDKEVAVRIMIQTLYTHEMVNLSRSFELSEEWIDLIDEAMASADSLIHFSSIYHCPACHTEDRVPFDLETWALHNLYQKQQALLDMVHLLASCYHWSESQILALPAGRRSRYVELIETGAKP
jgi:hypothetical protein